MIRYREIAQLLYPPFKPDDGLSLEEIERSEKEIKFRLPKTLRDFYMLAGNHEQINYSFNRLIGVEYLEIKDSKMVFYQENQSVCDWAIDQNDFHLNDPPVWQGQWINYPDEIEWYMEASRLSVFLTSMLCWQSVMGGLPFVGNTDNVDESTVRAIEDSFELINFGKDFPEIRAYISQGKIICLSASEKEQIMLDAGASDEEKFLEIEELLQIEWNYCSLDD